MERKDLGKGIGEGMSGGKDGVKGGEWESLVNSKRFSQSQINFWQHRSMWEYCHSHVSVYR